jgi:hypothetical protein
VNDGFNGLDINLLCITCRVVYARIEYRQRGPILLKKKGLNGIGCATAKEGIDSRSAGSVGIYGRVELN